MRTIRCLAIAGTSALMLVQALHGAADAQVADYPKGRIAFIVGFAPGGGIDTMARVVAQELTEQFGYQIVIENRPGAASNIAAKAVASAAPDGYSLLFTGNSFAINQTLYKNANYTTDELRPVAFAAVDSQALAVHAGNPTRTLAEFLAAAGVLAPLDRHLGPHDPGNRHRGRVRSRPRLHRAT